MSKWTVEASEDGSVWIELVSLHSPDLARAVFDTELLTEKKPFIRLLAPDGTIQERAKLMKD